MGFGFCNAPLSQHNKCMGLYVALSHHAAAFRHWTASSYWTRSGGPWSAQATPERLPTPVIAGMILAIKELVHVENVRQLAPTSEQEEPIWVNEEGHVVDAGRAARKAPRGFKVVGNLMDEQRDASLRASRS